MADIREKIAADEDRVAEIVALATKELRSVYVLSPRRVPSASQREDSVSTFLVAVEENVVAGVVEYRASLDAINIQGLAVHPQKRQKGIARALIGAVERIAVSSGKPRLNLSAIKETGNPKIFAKLGFDLVNQEPADGFQGADGQEVSKVNMCRNLA